VDFPDAALEMVEVRAMAKTDLQLRRTPESCYIVDSCAMLFGNSSMGKMPAFPTGG
jgi:hypothetical protein